MSFTHNAQIAFSISRKIAGETDSPQIEPEHLFFGILSLQNSTAVSALTAIGIPCDKLKEILAPEVKEKKPTQKISYSEEVSTVVRMAGEIAHRWNHQYVGTEHLIFAIFNLKREKYCERRLKGSFFQSEPTVYIDLTELKREIFKIIDPDNVPTEPEKPSIEDVVRSLILKSRYADAEALCRHYRIEFDNFGDAVKESLGDF